MRFVKFILGVLVCCWAVNPLIQKLKVGFYVKLALSNQSKLVAICTFAPSVIKLYNQSLIAGYKEC